MLVMTVIRVLFQTIKLFDKLKNITSYCKNPCKLRYVYLHVIGIKATKRKNIWQYFCCKLMALKIACSDHRSTEAFVRKC